MGILLYVPMEEVDCEQKEQHQMNKHMKKNTRHLDKRIAFRLGPEERKIIDALMKRNPDLRSISAAIRHLIRKERA